MLVYRVEHRTGNHGPYVSGCMNGDSDLIGLSVELGDAHLGVEHPSSFWDIPNFTSHHSCCFSSLESLEEWFEGWLDILQLYGYIVRVFETDISNTIMGHSTKQLALQKEYATLKQELELC